MKKVSRYGFRYKGVSLDPISKTIPDQNLSVEEILRRFTTGILTPVEMDRQHAYGSDIAPDEDEDNLRPEYDPDFDLVDAYELAQQAGRLQEQLKREKQSSKKEKQTNFFNEDDSSNNEQNKASHTAAPVE